MEKKRKLRKANIKKGDMVVILAGKDKGKQGKVLNVDYKKARVTVERINLVRKSVRRSQMYPQGGIIDLEAPIDISNVKLICPKCNQRTKIMRKTIENGKRVRVCKKCNEIIDKV